MPILIITEKTSQARDLRAALGDRFGQILPRARRLVQTRKALHVLDYYRLSALPRAQNTYS